MSIAIQKLGFLYFASQTKTQAITLSLCVLPFKAVSLHVGSSSTASKWCDCTIIVIKCAACTSFNILTPFVCECSKWWVKTVNRCSDVQYGEFTGMESIGFEWDMKWHLTQVRILSVVFESVLLRILFDVTDSMDQVEKFPTFYGPWSFATLFTVVLSVIPFLICMNPLHTHFISFSFHIISNMAIPDIGIQLSTLVM